jgi:phytoene dehydrogenase-like protein
MVKRYDVIVAGAGLGGLSAAAFLARRGRKVLLLERHIIPGGYATSFVRGRFEFEVALHELSGIGPQRDSSFYRYLTDIGVAERLELVTFSDLYRSVFPGLDLRLPAGEDAYVQTLTQAFPHEADGIARFVGRVLTLESEVSQMEAQFSKGGLTLPMLLKVPARFPNCLRYLPATWDQVLHRDVKDPQARAVLSQYWGYFGLPPSRCSFFYFAIGLASYIRWGASYPKGRSQALASAFLAAIEALGGETRMGCGVARVLSRDGRATGVVAEDGTQYECDALVSNVDPVTLCQDLIGLEQVSPKWLKKLEYSRIGPSSVNVYMGVGKPPEAIGATDHEVFVNRDYDMDDHHGKMARIGPPGAIAVTCYNRVYPEISPPGTSQVVLTALAYGDPWLKVSPVDYVATKHRVAHAMIDMAETICPGLRAATETIEVSTPLTNLRYAGNVNGAIYGFEQPPWDHTVLRLSHQGPLEGLYLTGAWTQPGGGFQPVIMSGQMAGGFTHRYLDARA